MEAREGVRRSSSSISLINKILKFFFFQKKCLSDIKLIWILSSWKRTHSFFFVDGNISKCSYFFIHLWQHKKKLSFLQSSFRIYLLFSLDFFPTGNSFPHVILIFIFLLLKSFKIGLLHIFFLYLVHLGKDCCNFFFMHLQLFYVLPLILFGFLFIIFRMITL